MKVGLGDREDRAQPRVSNAALLQFLGYRMGTAQGRLGRLGDELSGEGRCGKACAGGAVVHNDALIGRCQRGRNPNGDTQLGSGLSLDVHCGGTDG